MENNRLTKKQRTELLRKIRKASGVAQYALDARMTDEQLTEASKHLDVLALIKAANDYNRRHQGLNTQRVNEELVEVRTELTETQKKLEMFLNIDNSEILQAGRWLMNAFSKKGSDRQSTLLERDLVHKEDYNEAVDDMGGTISELDQANDTIVTEAQQKISELEKRIDTLRRQQTQIKDYISNNDGFDKWKIIAETFQIEA